MSKLPMNLPNKITLTRILLVPVYLLLIELGGPGPNWAAAVVFAVAAATDWLDGNLARKRGEITDFGKFMDPIADKLLVLLPMIQFVAKGMPISVWVVIITAAREVIVSGFRLVAASRQVVIAAEKSGKLKTTVQMLAVLLLTLDVGLGYYVAWVAGILALYSGVEIILRNLSVLEEKA